MSWRFETERLYARDWQMSDAELAFPIYSDQEVTRFIGGVHMNSLDEMSERMDFMLKRNAKLVEGLGSYPVFCKQSDELVGTAMIKPLPDTSGEFTDDIEIGWHLARAHWGKGFATEFALKLLELGFVELQLDILHAIVDPPNTKSSNVARRLGMTQIEDTDIYYDGQTVHHFIMTRTDYLSRAQA